MTKLEEAAKMYREADIELERLRGEAERARIFADEAAVAAQRAELPFREAKAALAKAARED